MEVAEVATHASVWIPSEPLKQDTDAHFTCPRRHADKRTRTADHPTTAKQSADTPRSCSKVQSAFASPFPDTAARDHALSQLVSQIE